MKKVFLRISELSLPFLPYFFVFIASLYQPLDPDLGWHLKLGEYFFKYHSILRDNRFSSMMPNFHWTNSSWLTDIFTYAIYNTGGFLGLTLVCAAIITLTFYFFSKAFKLSIWDQVILFPILCYLENGSNSLSFKGEQLTFLFLSILIYLISQYKKNPKFLTIAIPLLFLWVNMHGEFLFGLFILLSWVIYDTSKRLLIFLNEEKNIITINKSYIPITLSYLKKNKKEILYLSTIILLAVLITFINPFGIGIYKYVLSFIVNPLLKDIVDYLPMNFFSNLWWNHLVILIVALLAIVYLLVSRHKVPAAFAGIFIIYLYSFFERRYAWPSYYLMIPILQIITSLLSPIVNTTKTLLSFLIISVAILVVLEVKLPMTKYSTFSWDDYCNQSIICSPKSAQFLIDHKLTHNVFSLYGWGAWLIWNYPQIKPAIDGRMHLWKDNNGYSAFADYIAYQEGQKNIDSSSYNVVYILNCNLYLELLNHARQGKWTLVYLDPHAAIFIRNGLFPLIQHKYGIKVSI